jgi:hypothetical protein
MSWLRTTLSRCRVTWAAHIRPIAVGLLVMLTLLTGVIVAQAIALLDRGWTPAFGTLPDYIAAFGTAGTLMVAILVLRHEVAVRRADESERRAAEAAASVEKRTIEKEKQLAVTAAKTAELLARGDQARLVILEFEYNYDLDDFTNGRESFMIATVRNLSNRPIFDVEIRVPQGNPQIRLGTYDDSITNPGARAIDRHDKHTASYEHVAAEVDWDWLSTEPVVLYTDVNGARWSRTMAGQPRQITA